MGRLLPALLLFLAATAGAQDFPLAEPVPVPARGSNVIAEPGGGFYALTSAGVASLDDPRVLSADGWIGHTGAAIAAAGHRSVAVAAGQSIYGVDPRTSETRWSVRIDALAPRLAFDGTNYVAATKEGRGVRLRWIDEEGNVLRDTVIPAPISSGDGELAIGRSGSTVVVAWHDGSHIDAVVLRGTRAQQLRLVPHVTRNVYAVPRLAIASRGDSALVVWTEYPASREVRLMAARASLTGERTQGQRSRLSRSLATQTGVSLLTAATDGSRDRIAWSAGERVVTFADVSEDLQLLEPVLIDAVVPYLAVSGGRMIDAWRDLMGILRGPGTILARELSHDSDADVAWTGDRYIAAWVRTGDPYELVLRTYDRDGQPLTEPRVAARASAYMSSARVVAAGGTALATWATYGPEYRPIQNHAARVTVDGLQAEEIPLGTAPANTSIVGAAGRGEFLLLWMTDAGVMRRIVPAAGPVAFAEPELLIERGKDTPVCAVDPVLAGSRYHLAFTLCHPTRYLAYSYTAYLAEVTSNGGFARRLPVDRADAVASGGETTMVFRHSGQVRQAAVADRELHMVTGGSVNAAALATEADAAFTGSRFLFATTRDYTWFDAAGQPLGAPVPYPPRSAAGARVAVAGDGRDGAMLVYQWGAEAPVLARLLRAE